MTKSRSVIAWKEGGERRKGVMDLFVFLIVVIVSKVPTCQNSSNLHTCSASHQLHLDKLLKMQTVITIINALYP